MPVTLRRWLLSALLVPGIVPGQNQAGLNQLGLNQVAQTLSEPAPIVPLDRAIPAFHRVDDHVLRGAQPGSEGIRALAAAHIHTIIDLRPGEERTGKEKELAEALGMRYVNIPMNGLRAPDEASISAALATLDDQTAWPVFVHCKYGKDRTGTVIACYRIQHDKWNPAQALAEAKKNGMHASEFGMKRFILDYVAPTEPPLDVF